MRRRLAGILLAALAAQTAAGAGNILLKAPLGLQLLHLLLADGVWIALVLLTAERNRATAARLSPEVAKMEA
jgi:heme A synthase